MRMEQRVQVNPEDEFRLQRTSTAIVITRKTPEGQLTSIVLEGREDQLEVVLTRLLTAYLDELTHRGAMIAEAELAEAQRILATMEEVKS